MKQQTLEERLELYLSEKGSKDNSANKLLLTASAVTAVGAILVPPPAEASIVYSGVKNSEVTVAQDQKVDIDEDGNFEFTFKIFSTSSSTSYIYQSLSVSESGTAEVIKGNDDNPARLSSNYVISSQREFDPIGDNDYMAIYSGGYGVSGNFPDKPPGYLGVQFKIDGIIHYGWIKYKTENNGSNATIVDWAYEDVPGKAIKAGATKTFNWTLFLPAIISGNKNN